VRSLTFEEVQRLVAVFNELRWDLKDPTGTESERLSLFRSVLQMLTKVESALVLTITRDFFLHDIALYPRTTALLADQIVQKLVRKNRQVVALPLTAPHDIGIPKSAGMAQYLLRNELARRSRNSPWLFNSWDRVNLVNDYLQDRKNAAILLVDDFVGSGDTATKAVAYFKANYARNADEIVVCAMVSQQQGVDRLTADGVAIIAPYIRRRGISDSTRLADIPAGLALMDGIEKSLRVKTKFLRGYMRAEALVSMVRCPNNTFPIYWTTDEHGGKPWPAPFPR